MIILLDSGPLGRITNPRATPENEQIRQWLAGLAANRIRVLVPEITDYEVRRELLRAGSLSGVARLDQLKITAGFLPITTEAMLKAAEFWAQARQQGRPTTVDAALDGDVILGGSSGRARRARS